MDRSDLKLLSQLGMVGQLGLSLIMPLLLCIFFCYLLTSRFSLGGWIYIPGFFLGLGGSMTTAWKVYKSLMNKEKGQKRMSRGEHEVSFRNHF